MINLLAKVPEQSHNSPGIHFRGNSKINTKVVGFSPGYPLMTSDLYLNVIFKVILRSIYFV